MSEKATYLQWIEEEKEKGLKDVKFFVGERPNGKNKEEQFYAEANEIVRLHKAGKAMEHPELF